MSGPVAAPNIPFPDGMLDAWACLGAVTNRSVRVWARMPGRESASAILRTDTGQTTRAVLVPNPEHDSIAAVDLILHRPEPQHLFTVHIMGMQRRGRLAPVPGESASFSFAFGCCHQPFALSVGGTAKLHRGAGIYPLMEGILAENAAHFLALIGDQVYSDGLQGLGLSNAFPNVDMSTEPMELLTYYRHVYRGYFAQRGFRALLERFPTYMMWDDHDIIDNWGSLVSIGAFEKQAFKAASVAYREYQNLHNPGATLSDDLPYAYSFLYGNVGFVMLDLRSSRNYQESRVLDPGQWDLLEAFLQTASAQDVPTLFVGATIPLVHFSPALVRLADVVPGSKGANARDRWNAERFLRDRTRLLNLLFDWQCARKGRQLVVLSGDVHSGAAFQVRRKGGFGELLQWTSSSLSAPGGVGHWAANQLGTLRVNWGEGQCTSVRQGLEPSNNFGMVEVRPAVGQLGHDLTFTLYAYDAGKNRLRQSFSVKSFAAKS